MKFVLLAFLVALWVDAILGRASVVIKNETVFVDEKPLNLTTLKVVDDLPYATRYFYQAGDTNVTITKFKVGNGIAVSTVSRGSPEDAAKLLEVQKQLTKNITNKAKAIQKAVSKQIADINKQINENLKDMFSAFPPFF